ncbi:MAG: zinc ABC transporter substrate-binding protein [Bacteroidales bacterium]|nr:zinc ABC transporter substrate-binding protein [Bacteroidales bacterium]
MKKYSIIILVTLIISGCSSQKDTSGAHEITVSILPQKYFVTRITGDLFPVNVMVPPGASPATYDPTPSQLTSLAKTDLYFKMGYTGFEMAWMDKLAATNDSMTIIDLSEGIDLITEKKMQENVHPSDYEHGHQHGGVDPHTWLSPLNVKIISRTIHKALSYKYPEYREVFDTNLESFLTDLDSLDQYISDELTNLKSVSFFTYHPSLSYFARDYKLDQHPLELGGKTPSSAHMKKLIDTGAKNNIKVIFLQMQFDQKNAEVLANETGAQIVQINPLDPDWMAQLFHITEKLKEHLK